MGQTTYMLCGFAFGSYSVTNYTMTCPATCDNFYREEVGHLGTMRENENYRWHILIFASTMSKTTIWKFPSPWDSFLELREHLLRKILIFVLRMVCHEIKLMCTY